MRNEYDAHQALCDAVDQATAWMTWSQPAPRRRQARGYSQGWWCVMGGLTLATIVIIILTR